MPRTARIVVPGAWHHVTQRGNNRQDVFFVEEDRHVYLEMLREQGQRFGFQLIGYCLMTNHVHLIGVPEEEDSLAKAIGRCHWRYTQYVNGLHGRSGHLWQNRFHSCTCDEAYGLNALAYVELNPVRARMVRRAWEYPWSSAARNVEPTSGAGSDTYNLLHQEISPEQWRATLEAVGKSSDICDTIRRNTYTGRPLGSDSFLSKVEHYLGRRVRALPVGRPQVTKKKSGDDHSDA